MELIHAATASHLHQDVLFPAQGGADIKVRLVHWRSCVLMNNITAEMVFMISHDLCCFSWCFFGCLLDNLFGVNSANFLNAASERRVTAMMSRSALVVLCGGTAYEYSAFQAFWLE